MQAAMGVGVGAQGWPPLEEVMQRRGLQALQAEIAPQLIQAVQAGMTNDQLAELADIPADQAAELMRLVREG